MAKALGLDEAKVTVHVTMLGGAFGRKSKPDFIVEAALLAKAAGAPVRVQWTREDDLRHDYYHSTSAQRLEAGLDATGKVTAWQHRIAFPPIGSLFSGAKMGGEGELQQGVLDLPLAIENVRAEIGEARAHTRIGWMRSVANVYHAFAVQSFVDELAHERGKDPRENLLELLGAPRVVTPADLGVAKVPNYGQSLDEHPIDTGRLRRVIERVTELSRWGGRKAEGRSLGLAAHRSFLTYVSSVVSVVRAPDGLVRVDEAWIVADAGTIINLERVRSQLEGAVIFGLSLGLYGAITMKAGATEQSNFHDFRLMRIAEAPRTIHVDVIASEGPPGGVGEPPSCEACGCSCPPLLSGPRPRFGLFGGVAEAGGLVVNGRLVGAIVDETARATPRTDGRGFVLLTEGGAATGHGGGWARDEPHRAEGGRENDGGQPLHVAHETPRHYSNVRAEPTAPCCDRLRRAQAIRARPEVSTARKLRVNHGTPRRETSPSRAAVNGQKQVGSLRR